MSIFELVSSLRLTFLGANVTVNTDTVLLISLSSTVTVSGVDNIALDGSTVFENHLISSAYFMRTDSLIALAVCQQGHVVPG